jgi:hypothetical protein
LEAEKEAQKNQMAVSYKELIINKELRKPLVVAVVIQVSQVSGENVRLFPAFFIYSKREII